MTTKAVKSEIPMFEYQGARYPFLVANRTGTIGSPIVPPGASKPVAIIVADFVWKDHQPFIDHMNLNIRDERSSREDESIRKRANITQQNAELFKELCVGGELIKINEAGERSEPIRKTSAEMLSYQPEIQSQIIDDWLGNFHIERIFPEGSNDVDALLSTPESILFECRVGNYKSPTFINVFEFDVPSPEARRSYESDTFMAGTKQDGDKIVSHYYVNNLAKLRFAKKYFRGATGVMLGKDGEVSIDTKDLKAFDPADGESMELFKRGYNPTWWIRLADSLADCFNFGGK